MDMTNSVKLEMAIARAEITKKVLGSKSDG
ncbi:hypothetical protein SAMN05660900_01452 [Megasphaera cerevisiae DSM 20462]|nr:hypothetical protein SAMN05660900_01452 [Megasphaera cerevisiae DSM 20462]